MPGYPPLHRATPIHVVRPVRLSDPPSPATLDARLAAAEAHLDYVDHHAYGRLDGAECQSLAAALEGVRAVRAELKTLS